MTLLEDDNPSMLVCDEEDGATDDPTRAQLHCRPGREAGKLPTDWDGNAVNGVIAG